MKNIPFLNRVRQSLTLMALLLAGQLTTVAAATNITADDITMGIGDTYTVEVKLTADEAVINPQFDIALPDGIEFVEDSQAKGSLLTRSHSLNVAKQTGNVYRFLVTSTTNAALSGTEGTLLTFQIKANKKLSDKMGITNKYMQSATYNKEQTPPRTEYSPDDTEVSITADVAMDGDATVSVPYGTTLKVTGWTVDTTYYQSASEGGAVAWSGNYRDILDGDDEFLRREILPNLCRKVYLCHCLHFDHTRRNLNRCRPLKYRPQFLQCFHSVLIRHHMI